MTPERMASLAAIYIAEGCRMLVADNDVPIDGGKITAINEKGQVIREYDPRKVLASLIDGGKINNALIDELDSALVRYGKEGCR
ncbi:hypothetical protein [Acidiphilium sp.]|uniref:hypothetical protein n=1 Tax=Acidiphilium sp. TaxID=527 RepID=UPI002588069D|nr:hypothetical protein [Acidiphilium sp.]